MGTLERVSLGYLLTVLLVGLSTPGGGDAAFRPWLHTAVIATLLLLLVAGVWLGRVVSPRRHRWLRALLCCVSVPIAFSAMGWLLPAVQPQPCEWWFCGLDLACFGGHPTVWLQALAWPPLIELLQWVYAAFYLIPITSALLIGHCRGGAAFDRAMTILVFGFLCSYLGYLLVPTRSPELCLDHGAPLRGIWLAADIHALIAASEANVRDCFPSGHTMLSLMSVMLVWRWAPRFAWPLTIVVSLLVFSTMALRYHWVFDVIAGAALAWPCLRLCDHLLDRDGAPPA